MKLRKIEFNNHPVLKNLQVSFTDENENTLDTIILIGNNGSGKTSILRGIFEGFNLKSSVSDVFFDKIDVITGRGMIEKLPKVVTDELYVIRQRMTKKSLAIEETDKKAKSIGKIIYMPAEINFNVSDKVDTRMQVPDTFLNRIDQNITKNISSFIATRIENAVFKNENMTPRESMKIACEEINSIFKYMDMEVELVGLSKDDDKKPIFKNKKNETFLIESLSSGEKQLFLRALSLKFLDVNDSIILIDEPELSLHPEWQRKIIKVYENIGCNNQLIIATHSPHVVSDIKKEQLRILHREHEGISVIPFDKMNRTYGQTIENILLNVMGLDSRRNDDLEEKLKRLQVLLRNNDILTDESFNELLNEITEYLDDSDVEMALINAQIKRLQMRGVKNAEGK